VYTAEASVVVNAAPQIAWEYVSNYQNFDQFMPNIKKIELLSGDTSEWHLSGPLGIPVSWQAITTTKEAPKHLAWHSTKGTIDTKGFIKIEPSGSGSKITVHMEYQPPLGAVGEAFASLFKDPQVMLEDGVEKLGELLQGGSVVVKDKEQTRDAGLNSAMAASSTLGSSSVQHSSALSESHSGSDNSARLANDREYTHGDPSLSGSSLMDSSSDRDLEGDDSGNVNRRG
jgi:carbon monoxide dehydrogenase subunit G